MGDDNIDVTPTWEIMVQSPTLEPNVVEIPSKHKIKLKYGGYFRFAKNSCRKRYCFGYQKCIYIDTYIYNFSDLIEEITKHYPSNRNRVISICFVDKYATDQSFIKLDSHEKFQLMLNMYKVEKEVTVYVTTEKELTLHVTTSDNPEKSDNVETSSRDQRGENEVHDESEYSLGDESYHSYYSSDSEFEMHSFQEEIFSKKSPTIKVNSTFDNVKMFRRALIHYALINEFENFLEKSEPTRVTAKCVDKDCKWRIHASLKQDGITFEVKTFVEAHSCIRSNKGGNKVASQGWIASVVKDKLKSDGDVSPKEHQKWVMKNYNVDISYDKVRRGKDQAYAKNFGKWEDSFMQMNDFKELLRNPGSVVDIEYEKDGDKKLFLRFFISLRACSTGFLNGCRPYIALDACHLKGRFNGVLVAATSVDGNNSIFPVAYGILESENKNSWIWFLELLKKAIGTPNGLVVSSDMQKGLQRINGCRLGR